MGRRSLRGVVGDMILMRPRGRAEPAPEDPKIFHKQSPISKRFSLILQTQGPMEKMMGRRSLRGVVGDMILMRPRGRAEPASEDPKIFHKQSPMQSSRSGGGHDIDETS